MSARNSGLAAQWTAGCLRATPRSPTCQVVTCLQATGVASALVCSLAPTYDAGHACTEAHCALRLVDGIDGHHSAGLPRPFRVARHARRALPDVVAVVLDARDVELRALHQQLAPPGGAVVRAREVGLPALCEQLAGPRSLFAVLHGLGCKLHALRKQAAFALGAAVLIRPCRLSAGRR